ncbi:recombinase family protein [Bosea minatitlanensis]|nr:recombinase family protein [Bosea minatitlanensis]MCT4496148.1 recombinase family protein [Bosea minatitlanensis]
MARIVYARVSTTDQDFDIRLARLKAADCETIVLKQDRVHRERGTRNWRRSCSPYKSKMNLSSCVSIGLAVPHREGASLRVFEPEVPTAGDIGRMVITILGMVANMELKFVKDRQRAGAARAEGSITAGRKTLAATKSDAALPPVPARPVRRAISTFQG